MCSPLDCEPAGRRGPPRADPTFAADGLPKDRKGVRPGQPDGSCAAVDRGAPRRHTGPVVARAVRWGSAFAAVSIAAAVVGVAMADEPSGDSGIRGRVVACGIVHEKESCARDVGATKVLVRRAADARLTATARVDAQGRFRVALRPGGYLVEVASAPTAARPSRVVRLPVAVRRGAWTSVTLTTARLSPPVRG
jgi:hypothetical protein